MKKVIGIWFIFVGFAIFSCLLVYSAVQQDMRQSANDPQIQIAEDGALALSRGAVPADIVSRTSVDISESLSSFVIIFDQKGTPLESSARLHNTVPVPPAGVFDYAKTAGEDRFTWQPEVGVRSATVMKYVSNIGNSQPGFIFVGRSLREVEAREGNLGSMIMLGWLASVIFTLIVSLIAGKIISRKNPAYPVAHK